MDLTMSNRQKIPTQEENIRHEFKLALRKKKIQEALWIKRTHTQSVKGFDLHKCARRHKFKKRCWVCGSKTHLKIDCPIHEKNKLILRVAELERIVTDLTEALQVQLKNKKKREEKKKRKKAKKAQRKHRKKAEAQNIAVRIKSLLYKEEETWNGMYVTKADTLLQKLPSKAQNKVKRAYQELFSRDLVEDMVSGFCAGDDFYEKYLKDEQTEGPPNLENFLKLKT